MTDHTRAIEAVFREVQDAWEHDTTTTPLPDEVDEAMNAIYRAVDTSASYMNDVKTPANKAFFVVGKHIHDLRTALQAERERAEAVEAEIADLRNIGVAMSNDIEHGMDWENDISDREVCLCDSHGEDQCPRHSKPTPLPDEVEAALARISGDVDEIVWLALQSPRGECYCKRNPYSGISCYAHSRQAVIQECLATIRSALQAAHTERNDYKRWLEDTEEEMRKVWRLLGVVDGAADNPLVDDVQAALQAERERAEAAERDNTEAVNAAWALGAYGDDRLDPTAVLALWRAARGVTWFDWSDNDNDARVSIECLRSQVEALREWVEGQRA